MNRFNVLVKTVSVTLILLVGAGCASNEPPRPQNQGAEQLYREAKSRLDSGDFLGAVEAFEALGARYPFGNYTQQAQLDVAYAYLKQDEFDNAISSADRFIKLYPRSDNIDYAWYMKGLANFSRGGSTLERLFPRDMAKVDQAWLRASFADFDTLVSRFPNSVYTPDAIERMKFLHNEMARHELLTAQYYYKRGAMVATINRVQYLLNHFEGSEHVGNSLALMASAYAAMGQVDLQQDTLRVLALNEPKHPALAALAQ
ncbi:MAG: outer membrane protein assembly factor BamD [Gammaproteobacteria bacterium]|nr:outer membrane protein assembly factor BamD [Gammaproteobacteria bacterium]